MRTAVDTNIVSALWSAEPLAARMSMELAEAHAQGGLVVCAPVFAELLAHPKATQHFVEDFLAETGIVVDFNLEASVWRQAAKSFAACEQRRRLSAGDSPKRLLVDFIIASHALL